MIEFVLNLFTVLGVITAFLLTYIGLLLLIVRLIEGKKDER